MNLLEKSLMKLSWRHNLPVVLDACAVIAYLMDEPGADIVENVLIDEECYIDAINMSEVYKDHLTRNHSEEEANKLIEDLTISAGIIIYEQFDESIWKSAAILKYDVRRISLADCIGLSLSKKLNVNFYTSDHHEMDIIAERGLYNISFIR